MPRINVSFDASIQPVPPFRPFRPRMALPAVYDDELSYMELLAKVEKWLEDVVDTTNQQVDAITALYAAWKEFSEGGYTDSFEEFLDQWFADNQEHIDELLTGQFADELAAIQETADGAVQTATEAERAVAGKVNLPTGGTNGQVLSKAATDTGTAWADPIIPTDEQTETYITKWLNNHPEATTTVQDGAITTIKLAEGAVTDAKLAHIGTRKRVDNVLSSSTPFALRASIDSTGNIVRAADNRIMSGFISVWENLPVSFSVNSGYKVRVFAFDKALTLTTTGQWHTESFVINTGSYIVLQIGRVNDGYIPLDAITTAVTLDATNVKYMWPVGYAIDEFVNTSPKAITPLKSDSPLWHNVNISATGDISVSETRITSALMVAGNDAAITCNDGYNARVFMYSEELRLLTVSDWVTTFEFVANYFYRVVMRHSDNSNITPADADNITFSGNMQWYFVSDCAMQSCPEAPIIETSQYSLNMNQVGNYDECWEYQNWVYPMAQFSERLRTCLYHTFTTQSGYAGIATYDFEREEYYKTILKQNTDGVADDHNLIGVRMLSNGYLICAYSGGHNANRRMYVRVSSCAENSSMFDPVIELVSAYRTSYAQLFEYDSRVYLFYRGDNNNWLYRYSSGITKAELATWSEEHVFISTDQQMYCTIRETTTTGVLRLLSYTNPAGTDTNIRQGYIHLDSFNIYDVDNETIIGSNISLSALTILIAQPENAVNRLFCSPITNVGDTKILYCQFSMTGGVGTYYLYDNGTIYDIAAAGTATWVPKAQNGLDWVTPNMIVVSRGESGRDLIELYDYDGTSRPTLRETIANNPRTKNGIDWVRTSKGISDNAGRTIMFWNGYYNPNSYQDFDTNARIYDIQQHAYLV